MEIADEKWAKNKRELAAAIPFIRLISLWGMWRRVVMLVGLRRVWIPCLSVVRGVRGLIIARGVVRGRIGRSIRRIVLRLECEDGSSCIKWDSENFYGFESNSLWSKR